MKAIIDRAKTSPSDRKWLSFCLVIALLICLLYWWDAGFDTIFEGVICIVVALVYVAVRFFYENRPDESHLHLVKVGDHGVTGWDNRGHRVKIGWHEMSLVVVHNIVAGREITLNGAHKRLRIRDVFGRFDEIVRTVCDTCREKGIKCLQS